MWHMQNPIIAVPEHFLLTVYVTGLIKATLPLLVTAEIPSINYKKQRLERIRVTLHAEYAGLR